jgi:hypothetical protein
MTVYVVIPAQAGIQCDGSCTLLITRYPSPSFHSSPFFDCRLPTPDWFLEREEPLL